MKRIEKLIPLIQSYYDSTDPAHDWAHIGRVATTATRLAQQTDINLECILAAVYCHDLVNLPKDHPDRKSASTLSANLAKKYLFECGFDENEISQIQTAILEHSYSKGIKPTTLLSMIVQDADRIDALGAIGILRCAAVNAKMNSVFYDTHDPLAKSRELNDKKFMLDHYFVKLFRLPELMNTEQGKTLAHKRVEVMKNFIQDLMGEI